MIRVCWLVGVVLLVMMASVVVAQGGPVFPGDKSTFIRDVNYPDKNGIPQVTVMPGEKIEKEWEVENSGSVHWKNRWLWAQSSSAGMADVSRIKPTKVPNTAPKQRCILKATLFAPNTEGVYRVDFKIKDDKRKLLFPDQDSVYLVVNVAK